MKKILILVLIISTLYSCQNNKTANSDIADAKNQINTEQIQVLTLGTFHFAFPNLDVEITEDDDQIDVLDAKYQKEIELIVDKLAKFKPTKIVIEREPGYQKMYDSLYQSYLNNNYKLGRSEEQQIGFRLAKRMGLKNLYCTDAWGEHYEDVNNLMDGKDSIEMQKFEDSFYNHPDSLLKSYRNEKHLFKTQGIIAELKRLNTDSELSKSLGDYLIGVFKYETPGNKQFGVDFTSGWWFNRNLRIFRNIQRIDAKPEDRILVIYGAGHMNLLNVFFEASPEYQLLHVNDYLD